MEWPYVAPSNSGESNTLGCEKLYGFTPSWRGDGRSRQTGFPFVENRRDCLAGEPRGTRGLPFDNLTQRLDGYLQGDFVRQVFPEEGEFGAFPNNDDIDFRAFAAAAGDDLKLVAEV